MDDKHPPAETTVVDTLEPSEAFSLLAHETRFAILEALNETPGPMAFNDLYKSVGADDPGGFNYHLQKLTGRFVRHTNERYQIAGPGRQVIGAVLSGVYTYHLDADPVTMPEACLACNGTMETRFHETAVEMTCLECDQSFNPIAIPPGVLADWPHERAPEVVDRWVRHIRQTTELGLCYVCGGRIDRWVEVLDDDRPDHLTDIGIEAVVQIECDRCGTHHQAFPAAAVLAKPAVIAFHRDHGINLPQTPFWALDWLETGVSHLVSTDPLAIEIPITLGDETLVVTVDDSLAVTETRRT